MTEAAPPIVHLYYSRLVHESRLLRAARAAVEEGLAGTAIGIGYHEDALAEVEDVGPGVSYLRLRLPAWTQGGGKLGRLLRWPIWTWRAARRAAMLGPRVIQCHSLAAMPAGLLARRWSRSVRILYDAHELESERAAWSPWTKRIARSIERRLIRKADATIVVGPMIAQWYAEHYDIPAPVVVRNVPQLDSVAAAAGPGVRETLALRDDAILFAYVGIVSAARGLEQAIAAFAQAPPDRHLAIIGFGPLVESVRARAEQLANVHYLPPVPSEQVVPFVRSADIGISLIEDVSLSYRYCLPNKMFEYRHAGLAVLASDLPEMRAQIDSYGGGWCIANETAAISRFIATVTRDEIQATLDHAKPLFSWNEEREVYLSVLRDVLGRHAASRG